MQAVKNGKISEAQFDECAPTAARQVRARSVRESVCQKGASAIRTVAREGDDLSRRLAVESVTLLKNDKNLPPRGRNVGDEYFGASDEVSFVDLDVVMMGHIIWSG